MDLGKQYLDVFTKWADLQVKTGQSYFETVQKADKFDPSLLWDKTIEAYQTSIQGTLDAEVAGYQLWFKDVAGVKGLPEEALKVVDYSKDFTEQFTNAQQSVVDSGIKFLRQINFSGFPGSLLKEPPAKKAVKAEAS